MSATAPASRLTAEATIANAFHGIDATETIAEEQPYHRHAAYLFAMGADTRDVADALNVTTHSVRTWLRQPWFQQRVTDLMAKTGRDVTALFLAEAWATVGTILELRDLKSTPPTVRLASCKEILDRAFGKPKVFVETTKGPAADDPVAEAERLEKENAKLLSGVSGRN